MRGIVIDEKWLALFKTLSPQQLRVACHIMTRCTIDGALTISRRELAKELDVALANVQAAIGAMERAGVLCAGAAPRATSTLVATGIRRLTIEEPEILVHDPDRGSRTRGPTKSEGTATTSGVGDGGVANTSRTASRTPSRTPISDDDQASSRTASRTPSRTPDDALDHSDAQVIHTAVEPGDHAEKLSGDHDLGDRAREPLTREPHDGTSGSRSSPTVAADPESPTSEPDRSETSEAKRSDQTESETGSGKRSSARKAKRERALAELDHRAIILADALRMRILKREPGHQLRNATPWEEHAQRLKWAQDLDQLAYRRAGMSKAKPVDLDRAYDQMKRVIIWAFGDQGASDPRYRMVIESPASLAEKIDRALVRLATVGGAVDGESEAPMQRRARADSEERSHVRAPLSSLAKPC